MKTTGPEYIVAEITRNWPGSGPLVSERFEGVIAFNLERGYALHSFRYATTVGNDYCFETVIAVFQRKEM